MYLRNKTHAPPVTTKRAAKTGLNLPLNTFATVVVAAALDHRRLGYLTGTKVYRFVTSGKLCFVRIGKSSLADLDLGTTVLRALQNTTVLPALPYKAKLHTS